MARFVILRHDVPDQEYHWDWMFDITGDLLTTYSFPRRLCEEIEKENGRVASGTVKRLSDHRREYLDYEGLVSGNRGSVRKIDSGEFRLLEPDHFEIRGPRFQGTLRFFHSDLDHLKVVAVFTQRH